MAFGKNQGMVFFSGNPCGAFFAFLMLGVVLLAGVFLSKFWLSGVVYRELEKYQNSLVSRQFEKIRNTYQEMRG